MTGKGSCSDDGEADEEVRRDDADAGDAAVAMALMIRGARSRNVVATARYASSVRIGPAWGPTSTTALITSRISDLTSSGVRSWTDRFRRRDSVAVVVDAVDEGAEVDRDVDAATCRGIHLGVRRADVGMKDAHCSHPTIETSINRRHRRRRHPPPPRSRRTADGAAMVFARFGSALVCLSLKLWKRRNLTSVNDRRMKDRPTGLTHVESHRTHKIPLRNLHSRFERSSSLRRPWLSAAANPTSSSSQSSSRGCCRHLPDLICSLASISLTSVCYGQRFRPLN
jgi:hypothetical protein